MSKVDDVLSFLDKIVPDAHCELTYSSDYGFLISVMLSAQTTDKKVNAVTDILFKKYETLDDLKNANILDIETILKPLGLYKNKAKHVLSIANELVVKFNGKVPEGKEELMTLSGVGNKTANVVRAEIFKIPEFPVDTHVNRICKRLGFINKDASVEDVEKIMRNVLPREKYIRAHHQFIHFGRYFCKAQKPNCLECELKKYCCYEGINK
ncbi:MAG: endonuclease III [Bacilli bacterium]